MRFASHRDVARAIERGVRKAGLPVAYSAGFTPHPKISYSGGAPTGAASEAEFLEISLTRRCEPTDVGQWLDAALPDGIDVVDVVEASSKAAALLEASVWEAIWPGVAPDAAARAAQAFLDAPSVEVERLTSKGLRRFDARAAVVSLEVGVHAGRRAGKDPAAGCAILRMVVRQMTPAVLPDDLLTALCRSSALAPAGPATITRLWQGPLADMAAARATGVWSVGLGSDGPGSSGAGPVRRGQGHGTNTAVLLTDQTGDRAGGAGRPLEVSESQAGRHQENQKTARQQAGSAKSAPAGLAPEDEQLPRGATGQLAGLRAREPYGRDFPNARKRATGPTVRLQ
jgi:radical SAM-linked protein